MDPPPGHPNHRPSEALSTVRAPVLVQADPFRAQPLSAVVPWQTVTCSPSWIAGQARNDTERPTRHRAPDRASINPAAGSRQAVPGRADFWGGWAARAWAQRAAEGREVRLNH